MVYEVKFMFESRLISAANSGLLEPWILNRIDARYTENSLTRVA